MSKRSSQSAAEVFSALGDQTRLSVVMRLGASPLSATGLAEGARVSRQAIVKHLQVLEGAGLVSRERRGREVLYQVVPERLAEVRTYLDRVSASWDQALERLRRRVEWGPISTRRDKFKI